MNIIITNFTGTKLFSEGTANFFAVAKFTKINSNLKVFSLTILTLNDNQVL